MRYIALLLASVGIAACSERTIPRDWAEVTFRYQTDCSFEVTLDLRIDGFVVGRESFRMFGAGARTLSKPYYVTADVPHALGARWTDDFQWADTTVRLVKGQKHEQTLFLYCS